MRSLLFTAVIALSGSAIVLALSVRIPSNAGAISLHVCSLSSLKVSVENGDGLHHGVELIQFKNLTSSACTLQGYPEIEALLLNGKAPKNLKGMYRSSPTGSVKRATRVEMAWAGGVNWSTGVFPSAAAQRAFVPPVITLAAKTGVASSTLNWVDGPNTGTCPAFDKIKIGVADRFIVRSLGLGYADPLCYEFAVTPIVRGSTGAMNISTTPGKGS
jgi:hypothetical protein